MNFKFNTGQMERGMLVSLTGVLEVLQAENESELDIFVVEFPKKFSVKVDKGLMILVWDAEKQSYGGLTEPEPTPEPIPEPEPKTDPHKDVDPIKLALLKYELMTAHLDMPDEKKIIFAKEYSRLWSEHR